MVLNEAYIPSGGIQQVGAAETAAKNIIFFSYG